MSGAMEKLLLQHEVEQFLYHEANLLDERRYDEWLALLTEDIHYWMPVRRTTYSRESSQEFTAPGNMAYFDDDLNFLKMRVAKLQQRNSWSEDPPSRTRHFVSNIRITAVDGDDVQIALNFHLYRTRLDSEEDSWLGRREDTLRRCDGQWKLARRHLFLEQTVILAQNMSSLF